MKSRGEEGKGSQAKLINFPGEEMLALPVWLLHSACMA